MNLDHIKIIAFDADDTLWINEPYFREAEAVFCKKLNSYMSEEQVMKILYDIEMKNLPLYGYGIKSFMLSMVETIDVVSKGQAPFNLVAECIAIGKEQLMKEVILLDGVKEVLSQLSKKYSLVVATKGDLLDQETKLKKSGLLPFFHHIEIMSDKKVNDYKKVLKRLNVKADELLMVGNSLKSDVIPVIELGGSGIHVPFHTTWLHEMVEEPVVSERFKEIDNITDLLPLLD